jgi:hypothetical protein
MFIGKYGWSPAVTFPTLNPELLRLTHSNLPSFVEMSATHRCCVCCCCCCCWNVVKTKGEFRMLKCKGHSEQHFETDHFNIILISLNQTSLISMLKQIILQKFIDKRSEKKEKCVFLSVNFRDTIAVINTLCRNSINYVCFVMLLSKKTYNKWWHKHWTYFTFPLL